MPERGESYLKPIKRPLRTLLKEYARGIVEDGKRSMAKRRIISRYRLIEPVRVKIKDEMLKKTIRNADLVEVVYLWFEDKEGSEIAVIGIESLSGNNQLVHSICFGNDLPVVSIHKDGILMEEKSTVLDKDQLQDFINLTKSKKTNYQ